jgi:hypothetical protein
MKTACNFLGWFIIGVQRFVIIDFLYGNVYQTVLV